MLPLICAAAFLVFTQTFMVAPLIPRLTRAFASHAAWVGLAIPAYVVPQALATLLIGPLSDRFGRRRIILACLGIFVVVTALTATSRTIDTFIAWRVAAGLAAAGIVPIGLTLIGDEVPFARRGKAVGWLFGAIAGGTATGAAVGALLEPVIGWRSLFLVVSAASTLVALALAIGHALPRRGGTRDRLDWAGLVTGYRWLAGQARARRTYAFVLVNAILQSGVFTWLAVFLHRHYGLDETGIGLALLGYGVPGLLLGAVIGRIADRFGRARIIPVGIALTGLCTLAFALPLPLAGTRVAIVALSLGFDLTQPLLAAIATDLGGGRGQAVAVMAFSLFAGFGLGSLLFEAALTTGFDTAFTLFALAAFVAAASARRAFRDERPASHPAASHPAP